MDKRTESTEPVQGYEPPQVTVLGTLEAVTRGTVGAPSSDGTFGAFKNAGAAEAVIFSASDRNFKYQVRPVEAHRVLLSFS